MSKIGAWLAVCLLLSACSGQEHEDLRQWMREASKGMQGRIAKLPEVKAYQPVPYAAEGLSDPFRSSRIEPDNKAGGAGKRGGLQPDFEARELRNSLLEKYPLESLRMIGYLNIGGRPVAVIQADQNIKQLKLGEYVGQNFGQVKRISEREIQVTELVQDTAGEWTERRLTLNLQTGEGNKK